MKLLLTSGGITNTSIHDVLVSLLGKPIAECHALCIPTAQWGHPMCGPASVRGFIAAEPDFRHLSGLGWASLGVLELTALPTIGAERWVPWVREADVLLVDGGDASSALTTLAIAAIMTEAAIVGEVTLVVEVWTHSTVILIGEFSGFVGDAAGTVQAIMQQVSAHLAGFAAVETTSLRKEAEAVW